MDFKIIEEPKTSADWCNAANQHGDLYTGDTQKLISYMTMGLGSQLLIKDVKNAFKTGVECKGYSIDGDEDDSISQFIAECGYSVDKMVARCEEALSILSENEYKGILQGTSWSASVYDRTSVGIRSFSPLPEALKTLKPLNEIPKKWTLRHVNRMLANEQYMKLETRDRYTDDYAMDAAHNYYAGEISGLYLLKDLTESPSGWWISRADKDGEQLGINCHHFDYKQCLVDLTGKLRNKARSAENVKITEPAKAVFQSNEAIESESGHVEDSSKNAVAGILMMSPLTSSPSARDH